MTEVEGSSEVSTRKQPATRFAELAVTTNFSFLRGASHPEEMVRQAAEYGMAGIAVADLNSVAGVVRGWLEANRAKLENPGLDIKYVAGCRLAFRIVTEKGANPSSAKAGEGEDRSAQRMKQASGLFQVTNAEAQAKAGDHTEGVVGGVTPDILAWPTDRETWGNLCRLLTAGKPPRSEGECHLDLADLLEWGKGLILASWTARLSPMTRAPEPLPLKGGGGRGSPSARHWRH
ncbi:MAG: PHP domain-containing protein [Bauldia sp.]